MEQESMKITIVSSVSESLKEKSESLFCEDKLNFINDNPDRFTLAFDISGIYEKNDLIFSDKLSSLMLKSLYLAGLSLTEMQEVRQMNYHFLNLSDLKKKYEHIIIEIDNLENDGNGFFLEAYMYSAENVLIAKGHCLIAIGH